MYARWLIRPRLMRIRSALNEKFLKLYPDGDSLQFDFIDPVPDNRMELINEGTLGYEKKILTLNEARRRFGEDDWDGPEGDELFTPSEPFSLLGASAPAMWDASFVDEFGFAEGYGPTRPRRRPRKAEPNPDYPDEANREVNRMERGWKRRLTTELRALIAYLEREDKGATPQIKLTPGIADGFDWDWWAKHSDEVIDELTEAFTRVLTAEIPTMPLPQVQREAGLYAEDEAIQLLRTDGPRNLARLAQNRVNTLVAETIKQGESLNTLQRQLRTDFAFSPERARTIARTETAKALGQGQKTAAKSQGRSQKRWVSQGDDGVSSLCELNAAQDWIPIDEAFISGDETIPQHPNCRCTVIYRDAPIDEEGTSREGPLIQTSVRCPNCDRKSGENVALGTHMRCRRCKHEWEVE